MQLRQRSVEVEPVERSGGSRRVDARVTERQVLGRAGEHLDTRYGALELRAHLGERLDREHARAGRHEQARELPGAGADVDDGRPGGDPETFDDEGDDVWVIRRPPPLVLGRDRPERGGRSAVELQWPHPFIIRSVRLLVSDTAALGVRHRLVRHRRSWCPPLLVSDTA